MIKAIISAIGILLIGCNQHQPSSNTLRLEYDSIHQQFEFFDEKTLLMELPITEIDSVENDLLKLLNELQNENR